MTVHDSRIFLFKKKRDAITIKVHMNEGDTFETNLQLLVHSQKALYIQETLESLNRGDQIRFNATYLVPILLVIQSRQVFVWVQLEVEKTGV